MSIKSIFLWGATALALAIPAAAQSKIGYSTVDVGVFGGGNFFQLYQGENSRAINYDESGVFGFRFTEDPWNHWGIEEGFDVGRNNLRATVQNDPQVYIYGIAGRNYNLAFNGLYYFTNRESKWRPFLTVGPGITWYRGQNSGIQAPGGPAEANENEFQPRAGLWRRS